MVLTRSRRPTGLAVGSREEAGQSSGCELWRYARKNEWIEEYCLLSLCVARYFIFCSIIDCMVLYCMVFYCILLYFIVFYCIVF